MHIGSLGIQELLIILLIVVIVFGAKKLPDLGKSLGEGIKNFKSSISGKEKDKNTSPPVDKTTAPPQN